MVAAHLRKPRDTSAARLHRCIALQGCRPMTPLDVAMVNREKIRAFHGSWPDPRVGLEGFQCRGSGRVGAGPEVLTTRGVGQVGQEVSKCRGSSRVMTREIRVIRGSIHHAPRVVFD